VTGPASPLARLAALGFPETARLLESGRADAGTLAYCALNRMEARDRTMLPGSVPVIRARYAVARRLVRLALAEAAGPAIVNPTDEMMQVN